LFRSPSGSAPGLPEAKRLARIESMGPSSLPSLCPSTWIHQDGSVPQSSPSAAKHLPRGARPSSRPRATLSRGLLGSSLMHSDRAQRTTGPLPVLIVGAGPTGLALAVQLQSFGVAFRIIDRLTDRGRESRALAIQARTLELLQSVGIGDQLAAAGRSSTRLLLHLDGHVAKVVLGGFGATDTRFPYILFLSQAETERILASHLEARGVSNERGVGLVDFKADNHGVTSTLRHADGTETVGAMYLVGCDGAHSKVRKAAGIAFEGAPYIQDFLLGDV